MDKGNNGQRPTPMTTEKDKIGRGFNIRQDRPMDSSSMPEQTANKSLGNNTETFSK
jgi:hypothetical protein